MILASWNVNSIGVRLPAVLDWLGEAKPDVLCIQETKCIDEKFPADEFSSRGYHSAFFGQKTYNGVAIVSRLPIENVKCNFDGVPNKEQARFISAEIQSVVVMNSYVPNGQAVGSDKFDYKLAWLSKLKEYLDKNYKSSSDRVLLCGDFNVAPEDRDVYDPEVVGGGILVSDQERAALDEVKRWGFTDSFRMHVEEPGHYTWWDYRQMAFRRKMGFRIDHIWLSKALADHSQSSWIDINPRKKQRPSDHTPILVELEL